MQRNWIGRSTGAHIDFPTDCTAPIRCSRPGRTPCSARPTWCWRPSTTLVDAWSPDAWPDGTHRCGPAGTRPRGEAVAAYREFAAAKTEVERQAEAKEKTGVFIGAFATNPVNGAKIPVFIADYVLAGYGTGAIMAVPGQDERDWEFAEVFELPIVRTVQPPDGLRRKAYLGDGPAINSVDSEASPGRAGHRRGQGDRSSSGWRRTGRRGRGHLPAAGLAVQPAALLGRAVPDRVRRDGLPIALPESMLPLELPDVDDFSPKTFDRRRRQLARRRRCRGPGPGSR